MKTKYQFLALCTSALFAVGCDNKFQFEEVKVSCEPPASSARFGKNIGPVITAPEANEPFNSKVQIKGTCANGYAVMIRGTGLDNILEAECANGEFEALVQFNEGDGTKEIDVAQKTDGKQDIFDRRCFAQDTTPPQVKIIAENARQALNKKTIPVQGTCEANLDVEISGPQLLTTATTQCSGGRFKVDVTFAGDDGLKNVIATQIDRAGNKGNDDQDYLTDTLAPRVTLLSPAQNSITNGNVTVTGTCETGIPVVLEGHLLNNLIKVNCVDEKFSSDLALSKGDGIKNIIASQTDLAGNRGEDNRDLIKDTTAPEVKITSPAANLVTKSQINLEGSCESPYAVSIGGTGLSQNQSATCADNKFKALIQLASPDGKKDIVVTQTDTVGNSSSDSRQFVLDTTAPDLTIDSPTENSVWQKELTLTGRCETGLAVNFSGLGLLQNSTSTCSANKYSVALMLSAGDGSKNIIASQTDSVGNNTTVSRNFIRDNTAPILAITNPQDKSYVRETALISGSCESLLDVNLTGSGIKNSVKANCVSGAFSAEVTFTNGDGLKEIIATQTDASNNTAKDTKSYIKDTLAPKVIITQPAAQSVWRESLTLQGQCEDGFDVYISGDVTATEAKCTNGQFSSLVSLSAGEGAKTIQAKQTDLSGLMGSDTRTFIRRTKAPEVKILTPAENSYVNTNLTITGTCESNLNVIINGTGVNGTSTHLCQNGAFSAPISITLGDGVKEVIASQKDLADNIGYDTRQFLRDNTAPDIKITAPAANTMTSTGITLQGKCEVGLSVELSGSGLISPPMTNCNADSTFSVAILFTVGDGNKNIIVSQTDLAGNKNSDNRNFILRTVAPKIKITSPADNSFVAQTATISGTCESGLIVNLQGDGVSQKVTTACSTGGQFSALITFTAGDGDKAVIASQTDAANNVGQDFKTYKRDSLKPVVRITAPAAGTVAKSGLTLSGTCEVGLPVVIWGTGVNETKSANCQAASSTNGVFSFAIIFSNGDGNKEVRASQTDAANNTDTDLRMFVRDSTAPNVLITSPAANSYVGANADIKGSCETGLTVQLTGPKLTAPVTGECVASAFTIAVEFTAPDEAKIVTAKQTDAAGNEGQNSRQFFRDSTGPIVKFISPDENTVFKNTLTVKGSCESGLDVTLSGAGVQAVKKVACAAGTFSADIAATTGDGVKVVVATQIDAANLTGSDTRSFIRDTTKPSVLITSPAAGTVSQTELTLKGTCETGLVVTIDGAGLMNSTSTNCTDGQFSTPIQLTLADGNKVVNANQTDSVGNKGTDSKTYTLDATGPIVKITGPPTGTRAATGVTLTGTCKSGLPVSITGDVNTPSTTNCTNNLFSADVLFSPSVGAKKLTASQIDANNRKGEDTRNFVRANNAGYESYSSRGPGGKVDIMFVNDNSSSMEFEQAALGNRFSSFTTQLQDVDWQAGMITTDCTSGSPYNFCGQLFDFEQRPAGEYILSKLVPNYLEAFKSTIVREETPDCWRSTSPHPCPSNNEEGLKSTIESFNKRNTDNAGFFRADSDLAVVYLSDEDEMSNRPAQATKPADVVNAFKAVWGTSKKLSAYAIIIKPGDSTCLEAQKNQSAGGLRSTYGTAQNELVGLTGGMAVSICEPDYSVTLQRIGQDVTRLSRSFDLAQTPLAGTVKVTFNGVVQPTTNYTVSGKRITFTEVAPLGVKVEIFYEY